MTIKELKEELDKYPDYLDIVIGYSKIPYLTPIEIISRNGNTLELLCKPRRN